MSINPDTLLPSLADHVFAHAGSFPDRVAMTSEFESLTYAELAERVRDTAGALQALGIERGDRVAVLTTPRSDAYSLFIALNAIGAIWVGINPVYQYGEMAYVIRDAEPVALVFLSEFQGREFTEDAARLADEHDCIRHGFCLDRDTERFQSLKNFVADSNSCSQSKAGLPERHPEDVAMIVYTSGSTGEPKGCMLPNRSMAYRAQVQWQNLRVSEYPRVYCPLPLNHVGGMQMVAGATLFAGGTVNFRQKFDPAEVGDVLREGRVNFIVMFPTMYQLVLDHSEFRPGDWDSLECINFSGGVISRELLGRLLTLGNGVVQTCFGSTETCIGVIFSEPGLDPDVLAMSVGRPIADDCRVVDDDGMVCEVGEIGEFQVIRDFCMSGYFNRPEATAEAFTDDDYLRTGDLVEVLPDGSFRFSARRSEMYKSGGYNIYPREIEIALEELPSVATAAVCGVPDPLYSEVGYAFVLPAPGASVSQAELESWCRDRLANYKVPKTFEVLAELPLLPNGKLDKTSLRHLARDRVAAA